ncbi:acyltransferase [uncultured Alistipes sp.]|uniref:acyltransferase n=1 Tax=uncultured Alistipes sp. TaxID=538949 RepID=UPI0032B308F4
MMRKRSYVPYFDFLKGIAILLVIAIHTYDISGAKEGMAGDINLLLRQIIQCAVPIFVAVSGYFVVKSRGPYISYLKQRVLKIYVPALVWSLPYLIEAFGKGYRLLPILGIYFICGFSIYYFIALIMQFYVISPVLCKYFSNRGGVFLSCVMTAIAVSVVSYSIYVKGMAIPLVLYAGAFPVWMAFFVVGIWLGSMERRDYRIWPWILTVLVGLILSYAESRMLISLCGKGAGLKLSTQIYSFGAVMLLFSDRVQRRLEGDNPLFRFIVWVGSISFGIYLVHMYILELLNEYNPTGNWFLNTLFVFTATAGSIYIVKKILPTRFLVYLGLR